MDDTLFEVGKWWDDLWVGMPEFFHSKRRSAYSVRVHFRNPDDRACFYKQLELAPQKTKSMWYPPERPEVMCDKRYVSDDPKLPRYPVYIISKGRWDSRLTSKALDEIGVPYHIVVEPQEYRQYAAVVEAAKIIVTPFSNLGQGSIPVRNFVWEHSIAIGAERHWILDDNIRSFLRYQNNAKIKVGDGTIFAAAEDFVDRYTNIAIAGFEYAMFMCRKDHGRYPVNLNKRVYSCLLIDNSLTHRWRGRYNEDTDLCIRVLKDGWCTVLFNCFLADKAATMTMAGGNTDQLYSGDGRQQMAESLKSQHPGETTITSKWGRPQHLVDYRLFRRNRLTLRPGACVPSGSNEYGMRLVSVGAAKPLELEQ